MLVKKKILIILVSLGLLAVGLFQVIPVGADSTATIDHVVITPASTTLAVAGTQQFAAQAYDANNQTISNAAYLWMVTPGVGSINGTGLFTAGNVPGTYATGVEVVAVQGAVAKTAFAAITITGVAGPLDHVTITPATANVVAGQTQQFTAHAYDASNIAITGVPFSWSFVNGGTINSSGLFTAGTTLGTFANTVQVSATQGAIIKTATATVVVVAAPVEPPPQPKVDTKKLTGLFSSFLKGANFDNFLGGQWQVKNGANVDTIKAVAGVVQTATASSLTILANGQTTPTTFSLTSSAVVQPKNTQLTANDKVLVVTVNDQVTLVVKIAATTTGQMPPGLQKHGNDRGEGKQVPPGWSKGNKTGWNQVNGDANESDSED